MPTPRYAIAVVVGHSAGSRGAVAVDGVTTEWAYWQPRAEEIGHQLTVTLGVDVLVRWRGMDEVGGPGLRRLIQELNGYPTLRLAVELHFNTMSDARKSGLAVLHWPSSSRGKAAARAATAGRGAVIPQERSWNGPGLARDPATGRPVPDGAPLEFLRDTVAPAILYEGFYGSSATDLAKAGDPRFLTDVATRIADAYRAVK